MMAIYQWLNHVAIETDEIVNQTLDDMDDSDIWWRINTDNPSKYMTIFKAPIAVSHQRHDRKGSPMAAFFYHAL
jgi:hypothetical protein